MKKLFLILTLQIFLPFQTLGFQKLEKDYSVCFTPPQQCGDKIVQVIDTAKNSIYVQAYGFTSKKIINALIDAVNRKVEVHIILDRSNFNEKNLNTLKTLSNAGIKVYQDKIAGIAHNKIMIIDGNITITGSFNFTKNADTRNAENIIIITSDSVAAEYYKNWEMRKNRAITLAF